MITQRIKEQLFTIVLLLLCALGVFARSIEVINQNYIWGFDHGRDYLLAKEIVVDHNVRLIGTALGAGSAGFQGLFHGPGYYYFLSVPFIIFDGDPYGGIILMFLFGLAALAVSFVIGKKLFGTMGGLLMLTLVSLSPPLISQSRSIWNSHPSTVFVILSFLFTYSFLKKRHFVIIFMSSFFAGFIYNFEFAIAVPMSVALVLFSFFTFKKDLKSYLPLILGFIVAYIPMILFEIRHTFMGIRGMLSYLSSPDKSSHKLTFLENATDHYHSFLFNLSNTFPDQKLIPSLLLLLIVFFAVFVVIKKEKDKPLKYFLLYLCGTIVVSYLVFLPLRNAVYHYYLVHLNIVYIVLLVYVFCRMTISKNLGKYIVTFIIFFFLAVSVPQYTKMIAYDLQDYGGDAKIIGKIEALDYIYNDAKGEQFGLLVFSPPVYTYPYDYLIEWYGERKYGYTPHKEKKGVFYLLMEIDSSKPWSHLGWQQTVIKDGTVISEVKLPSGIVVQKRKL